MRSPFNSSNLLFRNLKINKILPDSKTNWIWDRRGSLEGVELTVSYLDYRPFAYPADGVSRMHEDYVTFPTTDGDTRVQLAGIYIQLLDLLTSYLNFTVRLTVPGDGSFGILDPTTNQWSGIMGQINSSGAHFAAMPLSVTDTRSQGLFFE